MTLLLKSENVVLVEPKHPEVASDEEMQVDMQGSKTNPNRPTMVTKWS